MNDISKEALKKYREEYPKICAMCGGDLEGAGTDEEIIDKIKEHDELFPGESLSTSVVVCDPCFQRICPGGKKISFQ